MRRTCIVHLSNLVDRWYAGVEANLTDYLRHHIQTILLLLLHHDRIPLIQTEAQHVLSEISDASENGGSALIESIRRLETDLDLLRGKVDIHIHNMADEGVDESELPDLVD